MLLPRHHIWNLRPNLPEITATWGGHGQYLAPVDLWLQKALTSINSEVALYLMNQRVQILCQNSTLPLADSVPSSLTQASVQLLIKYNLGQ
jgi:hypothetical protein